MAEWQWKRWEAVARLGVGKLTLQEAARVLQLSVRQVRRVRRAVERAGRAGLRHGNAGQVPVNKLRAAVRNRLLRLRRTKYRDFNDAHFTEKLAEEQPPIRVSVRTVRRVLRAGGVPAVRRRRPPKHRRRRDRKAQAGLMLLWDGSRHDWLEGRGPWLCLIAAMDDATGELLPGGHFVEQECAAAYFGVLRAVVTAHGVPWSIYMDQHGALQRNDDHWTPAEELRGKQDPTQVGQALRGAGNRGDLRALAAGEGAGGAALGHATGSPRLGAPARRRADDRGGERGPRTLLPRAQPALRHSCAGHHTRVAPAAPRSRSRPRV